MSSTEKCSYLVINHDTEESWVSADKDFLLEELLSDTVGPEITGDSDDLQDLLNDLPDPDRVTIFQIKGDKATEMVFEFNCKISLSL